MFCSPLHVVTQCIFVLNVERLLNPSSTFQNLDVILSVLWEDNQQIFRVFLMQRRWKLQFFGLQLKEFDVFFKRWMWKLQSSLVGTICLFTIFFRHINRGLSDIQSPNQAHSAYLLQIISTTLNHKITINIYLMKRNICDRIPENFRINIQQWWSTYILSNQ